MRPVREVPPEELERYLPPGMMDDQRGLPSVPVAPDGLAEEAVALPRFLLDRRHQVLAEREVQLVLLEAEE